MKRKIFIFFLILLVGSSETVSAVCPVPAMSDYTAYPPFVSQTIPPLVMFVMARDHKLFYKAYNDVMDLDDDGIIDSTYKDTISYYGYFDPNKCYTYTSNRFEPVGAASGPNNHYCSGAWSGNFMNWATMARIDILRKVLYGGKRTVDTNTTTVLSRTLLPRDAHSWAKVYNGSDLTSLIPYPWSSVTICNTNTASTETYPLIMVKNGYFPYAASTEGKECRLQYQGGPALAPDYTLRANVLVCDPTKGLEPNCLKYYQGASTPSYKPAGLLQKFGLNRHETDDTSDDTVQMYFGLISGSYGGNVSGGVLRSNITDIPTTEVDNATGIVKGASSKIIKNIDNFKVIQYNYSTGWYDIGGSEGTCVPTEPTVLTDGTCKSWGNPIGEMLYETIRYFQGKATPTTQFNQSDSGISSLTKESRWCDPYAGGGSCTAFPYCAKPFALIMSDVYPSYDSNQLPGSYWYSPISTSDTPSVQTLIDNANINTLEGIGNVFIGESAGSYDRQCTQKPGNFKSIRGLCVEEPTKQGSYYIAGLSNYARTTDLNPVQGDQKMITYAVATSSPLPNLEFDVGGKKAAIIPAFHDGCPNTSLPGCTSQGSGGDNSKGELVDFQLCQNDADWLREKANGYQYCYDIMWDDAEYGWDYDLDIRYRIYVKTGPGDTITVKSRGLYAAAGHTDYAGYLIAGVSAPGEYYDIKCGGSAGFNDCDRYDGNETPVVERAFTVTGSTAGLLKDPLWYAAKYGGFTDLDGSKTPNIQSEWDRDGNGVPDTYFYAANPLKLEGELTRALTDILNRASSGTAVSVLATTGEGEGAVYQALFYPSWMEGYKEIKWLGFLQGLFVDAGGNLREDTNKNLRLDIDTDLIARMWFDDSERKVKIDQFKDVNKDTDLDCVDVDGDGRLNDGCLINTSQFDTYEGTIDFDMLKTLWEGGNLLFTRDPNMRKIYTTIDGSTLTGLTYDTTKGTFYDGNASTLRPYLRAATTAEATNLINYIRGTDITGYRSRTRTIAGVTNVWKLGDIVYSSPVSIGRPSENFDFIYKDSSYATFKTQYRNRRNVVYAGGNDGMLHAFNAGFYDAGNHQFTDATGHAIGEELWSFVPRDLLPHLKWLADPNYTHVYFVDLKPKIASVRIFTPDATHPDGWGTILVGGMRLGGKNICVTDNFGSGTVDRTFMSTYFALDITDPLDPRLLWSFTDADLGLTLGFPAIVRIRTNSSLSNSSDPGRWFVVFGSGPTSYDGASANAGRVYALDLNSGSNGVISGWTLGTNYWKFSTGDSNAFMADAIAVDADANYTHDVAYIGETYKQGTNWKGKMFRLVTKSDTNPANWALSTLYDTGNKPITSPPTATKDAKGNLWVYFGTGRFFSTSDKTDTSAQSFYGIKDVCRPWVPANYGCTDTVTEGDLLNTSAAVVSYGGNTVSGVTGVTNWDNLQTKIDSQKGWYINFADMPAEGTPGEKEYYPPAAQRAGQRVISKPVAASGLVIWATYVPSTDICSAEGFSYMHVANYETGTAHKYYTYKREKEVTTPSNVGRSKYLRTGVPSAIAIMVTKKGKVKGFAQTSTGEIKEIELYGALPTYGFKGWKAGGIK